MSTVMTVLGPISSQSLGFTSIHEHLFSDLTRDTANNDSVLNDVELCYRELMRYKESGGISLIDQTTAGLRGHDHDLLEDNHAVAVRKMAEKTGLNIILGAGWYREPYYEKKLYRMKTDEIADELINDIKIGIDGTDVKAGILGEIGSHFTWISPVEERVFRAVARAHNHTGVSIATHAVKSPVGLDQLDILKHEGVNLKRVIIGHCQSYPHFEYHSEIAKRGAFVSFDRLGTTNAYEHEIDLKIIKNMIDAGLIKYILFGQDVCRKPDYYAYGGKGYAYISGDLVLELNKLGITAEQIKQITVDNPRRALTGLD